MTKGKEWVLHGVNFLRLLSNLKFSLSGSASILLLKKHLSTGQGDFEEKLKPLTFKGLGNEKLKG